jgi:hypothetical protein
MTEYERDNLSLDMNFDGENTVSFVLNTASGEQLSLALCVPDNYPKGAFVFPLQLAATFTHAPN